MAVKVEFVLVRAEPLALHPPKPMLDACNLGKGRRYTRPVLGVIKKDISHLCELNLVPLFLWFPVRVAVLPVVIGVLDFDLFKLSQSIKLWIAVLVLCVFNLYRAVNDVVANESRATR